MALSPTESYYRTTWKRETPAFIHEEWIQESAGLSQPIDINARPGALRLQSGHHGLGGHVARGAGGVGAAAQASHTGVEGLDAVGPGG